MAPHKTMQTRKKKPASAGERAQELPIFRSGQQAREEESSRRSSARLGASRRWAEDVGTHLVPADTSRSSFFNGVGEGRTCSSESASHQLEIAGGSIDGRSEAGSLGERHSEPERFEVHRPRKLSDRYFSVKPTTIKSSIYQNDSRGYRPAMDEYGDIYETRLKNLKHLQGDIPRKELAAKLGMEVNQLNHYFMQRTTQGYRNIGTKFAKRIEDAFEKPRGWLDQRHGSNAVEQIRIPYMRDVPVVGNVIATPDTDGYFEDMGFPPGAGESYVPFATKDKSAYAVRVKGDSMQPRYRPNEILVITPAAPLAPGEDVVIRTKSGRKMVKRLLAKHATEVELISINDAYKPITLSVEEIETIEIVAGSVRSSIDRP